jgi:hypothetical protein
MSNPQRINTTLIKNDNTIKYTIWLNSSNNQELNLIISNYINKNENINTNELKTKYNVTNIKIINTISISMAMAMAITIEAEDINNIIKLLQTEKSLQFLDDIIITQALSKIIKEGNKEGVILNKKFSVEYPNAKNPGIEISFNNISLTLYEAINRDNITEKKDLIECAIYKKGSNSYGIISWENIKECTKNNQREINLGQKVKLEDLITFSQFFLTLS